MRRSVATQTRCVIAALGTAGALALIAGCTSSSAPSGPAPSVTQSTGTAADQLAAQDGHPIRHSEYAAATRVLVTHCEQGTQATAVDLVDKLATGLTADRITTTHLQALQAL